MPRGMLWGVLNAEIHARQALYTLTASLALKGFF